MDVNFGGNKNSSFFENLIKLLEKALRITNFKNFNENGNPLFKENHILKIFDFQRKILFNNMFTLLSAYHDYIARAGSKNLLDTPSSQSTHYSKISVRGKATANRNLLQRITNVDLLTCNLHKLKNKKCATSIMQTTNNVHYNILNTETKQGYYYYYYYHYYHYYYLSCYYCYHIGIFINTFKDDEGAQTIKRILRTFYLSLIYIIVPK